MSSFKLDDYVDVAERIKEFYAKHPEGSLKSGSPPQVFELNGRQFVAYHAQAYRSPDDPCPADGWAWEPVPGPTPYTKDSELMNAETSAWGRAIVALGFETKKIASAQEVRNRSNGETDTLAEDAANAKLPSEFPIHFGKNRGVKLGELTPQQLRWYATEWPLQDDPSEYDHLLKAAAVALNLGDDSPIDRDPYPDVAF